jgi:amino acid transporter
VSNDRTDPTSVPEGTGATDSSHTGSVSAREYRDREARIDRDPEATEARRREEFGGFNLGADFFGWLVAVAMAVLLAGIVGAVAAAVGSSLHVTQTDAQRQAGTFGLATAIALLVVLMVAYYAGGYVAGRMSRYDGGRQGFGVWLIGVVVTIVVVAVGILFGSQYDIFQRVNLPSVPIPSDTATWGGIIALAAILIGTLLAAFVGGKVGRRYHSKVDRVRS